MNHHLTIGPHGGIDWVRRLGLETGKKSVNSSQLEIGSLPDARRAGSDENTEDSSSIRHSTDCIVAAKDLSASSDSDLLRSAPPWTQRASFRFSPDKESKPKEKNISSPEVGHVLITHKVKERKFNWSFNLDKVSYINVKNKKLNLNFIFTVGSFYFNKCNTKFGYFQCFVIFYR
jgi:hypothetical protein